MNVPQERETLEPGSPDVVLSLLASRTRRVVIRALQEATNNTLQFTDLGDYVSATTFGGSGVPDAHRDRTYLKLHHVHVPSLAHGGLIEYVEGTEYIRLVGNEFVQDLLDLIDEDDSTA